MPFVPGVKHDVFISYAHADDVPRPGESEGFITQLEQGIIASLGREGVRDGVVWRDGRLAGNIDLTEQLKDALEGSATLVVVLSKAYLASDWCRRERNVFLEFVRERIRERSRLFVVRLLPLNEREPSEFTGLLGYKLWRHDTRTQVTRPIEIADPADKQAFYGELRSIGRDLAAELTRLRDGSTGGGGRRKSGPQPPIPPTPEPVSGDRAVYLAEVTDDIDAKRDEVKRYLEQRGITVLPQTLPPLADAEFRSAVEADLSRSRLFVQLLSGIAGRRGVPRKQFDVARASGAQILQWRAPDIDLTTIEPPEHRELLAGPRVRAEGLNAFKKTIVEIVLPTPLPPAPTSPPPRAFVFVNRDMQDVALGEQVRDALRRNGLSPVLPLEKGTPEDIRNDLSDRLLDCDAVVLVYGRATERWVRNMLLQQQRVFSRRTEVLRAFAIFSDRESGPTDLQLDLDNFQFIPVAAGDLEVRVAEFARIVRGEHP